MKQLLIRENPSTIFFYDTVTAYSVVNWINELIIHNDILIDSLFNLNETHSCKAEVVSETEISINGDEDMIEISIKEITPIKL